MRNKRRSKVYRTANRKGTKVSFTPVIVMLCLSVGCGYAAAKYVVEPVVSYVPEITAEKDESSENKDKIESKQKSDGSKSDTSVVEDEAEVKETGEIEGYALQFGCYHDEKAANKVMTELGITDLHILKQDNMFKIIGTVYKTKDEAEKALAQLPDTAEAFVTAIYKEGSN